MWAGTSALITDQRGRVLIQRVSCPTTFLLPGWVVDENESPAQGAMRELREELGVTMVVGSPWTEPVQTDSKRPAPVSVTRAGLMRPIRLTTLRISCRSGRSRARCTRRCPGRAPWCRPRG
ncbi:NUDIX domain-containing protein [Streptomyces zhihengii]|uniref:NUDIX domain-containing protein n=1 Tax=Streptomyces zhihengii TaxID=1818004 RepID=UPI00363027AA